MTNRRDFLRAVAAGVGLGGVFGSTAEAAVVANEQAASVFHGPSGPSDAMPDGWDNPLDSPVVQAILNELRVGRLFASIPLPSKQHRIPMGLGGPVVKFQTSKLATRTLYGDGFAPECTTLPYAEYARSQRILAMADAMERAIIEGDKDGNIPATDVRRLFNGLLLAASATSAVVNLSETCANRKGARGVIGPDPLAKALLQVKRKMGPFGANPRDGAWLVSLDGYLKVLGLDECLALDKYRPNAVVFDGELAQLFGSPVVVPSHMPEDFDELGRRGRGGKCSVVLYAHRPSFLLGWHKAVEREMRTAENAQAYEMGWVSVDFQSVPREHPIIGMGVGLPVG